MSSKKNSAFHIKLPIFIALGLIAGILIGATMAGNESPKNNSLISSIHKFSNIVSYIQRDYVDEVDTEDLVETAISKMLEKLDPHSVYIPAKDLEMSKSQLEGKFYGIGIEFNILRDTLYVVSPLSGGPSQKLGIKSGDKIVEVDGENIASTGISNRDVVDMLRGEQGTKVNVKIYRKNSKELLNFDIVRDKIPQNSLEVAYMVDHEIGYMKISRFSATTYQEFHDGLKKLKNEGMTKLILDLQGNPGGYMDRAVKIADDLLDNDALIVYTKGKEKRYNTQYYAKRPGLFEKGKLIVLLDEGSASASEIVSGAVQDNDRGLVVGRRSFGKGLVQMPIPLNDGSELRLTISRYYTPSGRSIQKPYDAKHMEDYFNDRLNRYEHGEFFHADSIKMNDSLKYKTVHGRTVYGGGGIMPDYFVPLDTANQSDYFVKLFYSNALREYTIKYSEKNAKKLKAMKYEDFRKNFRVSEAMLKDLIKTAEELDVKFNKEQYETSKDMIKLRIKAQVARSIWDNEGFYPIFNEQNEAFIQAVKIMDNDKSWVKL
ncbi:S41 family peptidase [Persicobacter psychrovividus]|uniref:Peptidase S41 n=1 Tax=Persicobacter psychrovividus TaxID=387638 RepID=A0ABM7VDB7_9BACT|nr:peptidase S41 [Persicobacter psychrovividus]